MDIMRKKYHGYDAIQRPRSPWQASFSQCRPRAVQPSSSGKTEKNKEHFPLFLNAAMPSGPRTVRVVAAAVAFVISLQFFFLRMGFSLRIEFLPEQILSYNLQSSQKGRRSLKKKPVLLL